MRWGDKWVLKEKGEHAGPYIGKPRMPASADAMAGVGGVQHELERSDSDTPAIQKKQVEKGKES